MHLLVVESPAKAKTIKKYLGKGFDVLASYGHVRDLIPKEGAVDPENNFAMTYETLERNSKHVTTIANKLKSADALYLATDPDREGEAISWHLYELLKKRRALKDKQIHRVIFHEITKKAIQEAIDHPRELSMDLINAQQARRALDYLVGFNLSPLLWKKIRRGLSAGRVQSPALKMIVEREIEIENFKAREYWTIEADVNKDDQHFKAKLIVLHDEKLHQFSITDAKSATKAKKDLVAAAKGQLLVKKVEKKQRKRHPAAPFITSTLQQEASRKLGFTARRTMRVAQQLYEGIDTGEGAVGLITYMRTDSVTLAGSAIGEIRNYIAQHFGEELHPKSPRLYKTKSKNAQEAHEAIRPTSVFRTPKSIARFLSSEQRRLYDLIWKRTIACQMTPALIDTVSADLTASTIGIFRATGSVIAAPNFMLIYMDGKAHKPLADQGEKHLPPLTEGETVSLEDIITTQKFTEPPPRFNEASLIKTLEEYGIGRPSTYAQIISTLQDRDYVEMDKKTFIPTDVGRIVAKFLSNYFTQYVDYGFTASLEDELDAVSRGEEDWIPLLDQFWQPFKNLVEDTGENVQRADVISEAIDEKCPKCGKGLVIKLGRNGRFIGCTGYPECDYTRDLGDNKERETPEIVPDRTCPKCGSDLIIRTGRYGKFIGCSAFPACNHIEPLEKPEDTGVTCPQCAKGKMMKRKSRRGKIFYSCSTYPKCDYAVWNEPVQELCRKCGWPMLTIKTTKSKGTEKTCPQRGCDYSVKLDPKD